jgi:F-type H+-transporting ATPase subunit gamma
MTGLHAFLSQTGPLQAGQLARPAAGGLKILIVFGSDHGLCGSYNETLASHVAKQLLDASGQTIVLCVGAQMADALRDRDLMPEATFFPPASVDGIGRLANLLTQHLDDMRRDHGTDDMAVALAYFTRDGEKGQRPEMLSLLPLDRDIMSELQSKPWASRSLPSFSMSPPALFQALIRNHLFASMFRASAEALVTENAARLALMSQAEQSVDDRLDALMSETRSVRQNEITTELLDVIIGFEALKKKQKPPAKKSPSETKTIL